MTPTSYKTHATTKRRGRPKESYADWMARIVASVDAMARTMERKPPSFAYLHPAQRRIVQMLIEHMRSLPELGRDEWPFKKAEYTTVSRILKELFLAKYPEWARAPKMLDGCWDVAQLPAREGDVITSCSATALDVLHPSQPPRASRMTTSDAASHREARHPERGAGRARGATAARPAVLYSATFGEPCGRPCPRCAAVRLLARTKRKPVVG
jgi:hypothetical protein